jgi:hypothetical protein
MRSCLWAAGYGDALLPAAARNDVVPPIIHYFPRIPLFFFSKIPYLGVAMAVVSVERAASERNDQGVRDRPKYIEGLRMQVGWAIDA